MLLQPGSVFLSCYRAVAEPTHTSVGELYAVDDLTSGARRALELYPSLTEEGRRSFLRAGREAMLIASPRVVHVHAFGIEPATGVGYSVLDRASATHRGWGHPGSLGRAAAIQLVTQVLEGCAAMHAEGVVHGELDLSDVLVTWFSDGTLDTQIEHHVRRRVLAAIRADDPEYPPSLPDYLAPERAGMADPTPASDVWSLGLIAFFALTNAPYWRSRRAIGRGDPDAMAVWKEILTAPLPPASVRATEIRANIELPAGFDAWFARCVNRDPGARYPTAREAAAAWSAMEGGGRRA